MKEKWWKYPLAVLAFCATYFLAPLLIGIIWSFSNAIAPRFYQTSFAWINLISTILGVVFAADVLERIIKDNAKFSMIMCIIAAVYSIGVGASNYALGSTEFINMLSMIAAGIVAILLAVQYGKKMK